MAVELIDNSIIVKAALNDTTLAWLTEWASTIASDAKENTQLDGEAGTELRKSYSYNVDSGKGEASVGSPLEAAYWEEFGTGEHAVREPHRRGWWLYFENQDSGKGGKYYATREEAEEMAAYIKAKYNKTAIVTNGRKPSKTLESAFTTNKQESIDDLERKLGRRLGE